MVVSQRLNHAKHVTEPLDVVSAHIWERGPLARKTAKIINLTLGSAGRWPAQRQNFKSCA